MCGQLYTGLLNDSIHRMYTPPRKTILTLKIKPRASIHPFIHSFIHSFPPIHPTNPPTQLSVPLQRPILRPSASAREPPEARNAQDAAVADILHARAVAGDVQAVEGHVGDGRGHAEHGDVGERMRVGEGAPRRGVQGVGGRGEL